MLGIEPGAAGWEASTYLAAPPPQLILNFTWRFSEISFIASGTGLTWARRALLLRKRCILPPLCRRSRWRWSGRRSRRCWNRSEAVSPKVFNTAAVLSFCLELQRTVLRQQRTNRRENHPLIHLRKANNWEECLSKLTLSCGAGGCTCHLSFEKVQALCSVSVTPLVLLWLTFLIGTRTRESLRPQL